MNNYLLVFLLVFAARCLHAEDFKTIDGTEYKNVTVSRVEPDGITLTSSSGISKVYFTELPKDIQERFHYDSAKGAAYSSQEGANQEALRQQAEVAKRQIVDEKNRYWIEKDLGTQSVTEAQTSPTIEVMWATYGTASQDRDVREIVQSLVRQPRPDIRVGTELFGPVSTTNNSLFVVFVYEGLYYQTELRDGELISFANVQPAQATPEEAANAYKLWSDSIGKAVAGNPTRADIALSARLSNTPTWQDMRAKFRETVNRWNEEDKKARRVQANVERIKQLQEDSTRQQQAAANYEAKEKGRMLSLEQRKALTAEIKHLESQQQVFEKHNNHSDHNLNQEIAAKRALLNSLGGEF